MDSTSSRFCDLVWKQYLTLCLLFNLPLYAKNIMKSIHSLVWLLVVALVPVSQALVAETVVGKVEILKGSVIAIGSDGEERKLRRGKPIYEGDEIKADRRAAVSMKFQDGTKFALGSESAMTLDEFKYDQPDQEDKVTTTILKGAFRFITGLVAKKQPSAMNVQLGVTATIGIRGTNVAGTLIGESATIVLMEPDKKGQYTAIEVSNDHGEVTIDEPGFGTEVPDSRSAPTPVRRMKINTIKNVMRSLSSVTRAFSRPKVGGLQ